MVATFVKLSNGGFVHGESNIDCQEFFDFHSNNGIRLMGDFDFTVTKNPDKYAVDCFFLDGKPCEIKTDLRAAETGRLFIETVSYGKPSKSIIENSYWLAEIFEYGDKTIVGIVPRSKFDYSKCEYKVTRWNTEGYVVPVEYYIKLCKAHGQYKELPCTPPI